MNYGTVVLITKQKQIVVNAINIEVIERYWYVTWDSQNYKSGLHIFIQLDVDPQSDDDASPMSTYRWDLLECWFQLFSTSQNKSQIQFRTFVKKKNGFYAVVLVKTFPLMYQLLM